MRDHAAPTRIQLSRAKGWRMPPNTVRSDRARILGNPWAAGNPGLLHLPVGDQHGRHLWDKTPPFNHALSVPDVVVLHRDWLTKGEILLPAALSPTARVQAADALSDLRSTVLDLLSRLRGCDFACWCKPGTPCHAETLMEIANG